LDYQVSGEVTKLFPLGEGRLWAEGTRGKFYYDGRVWSPLQITGTRGLPGIYAIDLEGDVWLSFYEGRQINYYRLPGHVPPRDSPWQAQEISAAQVSLNPTMCQAQAYVSPGMSYRSPAQCEAILRAQQILRGRNLWGDVALDADGSLWSFYVVTQPERSPRPVLSHLRLDQSITVQDISLDQYYALAPDPTHGIWLGTDKGLVYSDGQSLRWLTLGLDICSTPAEPIGQGAFVVDAQGKAWMATADGLYALAPGDREWQFVPDPSAAGREAARSIQVMAAAPGGGVWATHGNDLFRLGGGHTARPVQLPDPRCGVWSLAADPEFVWSALRTRGDAKACDLVQFVISAQAWAYHPVPQGYLWRVVVGTDRTVYALGPEGLYKRVVIGSRSEFRPVGAKGADLITADRQGGVWVASRATGALWYYHSDRLNLRGQSFAPFALQQIAVDPQNRLWGALRESLAVYDGNAWRTLATPMRQIRELTCGPDERVWIVGDLGVAVYDPEKDK